MRPSLSSLLAAAALLAAALFVLPALAARDSPAASAATAQTETLSGVVGTDGWCIATNGNTSVDLDAGAPARITGTPSIVNKIRFLRVTFRGGATSTRMCHRIGGALVGFSCATFNSGTTGLLFDGQSVSYQAARDFVSGGLPQLDAQANAGTDGFFCVDVGW